MQTSPPKILPLYPSGLPDVVTGWAHLLRLWYKIVIEMVEATVPGWGRDDKFDILILQGVAGQVRGLNIEPAALDQWIASLDAPPIFDEFVRWIKTQDGNNLNNEEAREEWNKFTSTFRFDRGMVHDLEVEFKLHLGGLWLATEINPIVDAAMFHKIAARMFEPSQPNPS